jgi:hypothetical protein
VDVVQEVGRTFHGGERLALPANWTELVEAELEDEYAIGLPLMSVYIWYF